MKYSNVYKLNLLDTAVFVHKLKNRTAPSLSFLEKFKQLLIHMQHAFQVGITENHKLNDANVDFVFPLKVQQYGATASEVRKKKFNRLLILKLR